ncbi:hypothetical protein [Actinomadura flavalba]|uniref:hypothetical protein n=1 Tax=Actinomadura flavalba TaxID=1120938 RepID=UPI00036AD4F6|nr:hypothetical protein [Actinomadura flavalba]
MVFLGLVLVVVAVAVGVSIVLDNGDTAGITAFGEAVPGVENEWQVFLAGAVVTVVFVAGVMVAAFGIRRSLDLRRELRDLRDEHEESITTLELEKRRLQRELAQARQDAGAVPAQRSARPQS